VTPRCVACGRFIAYRDIEQGVAHYHFIPDSHFGPEEEWWECPECNVCKIKTVPSQAIEK
jgi:uncharacterized protein with PIN domain